MADYDNVVPVVGAFSLKDNSSSTCVSKFLDSVAEWKLFSVQRSGSLQEVVSHTHTCLGSAKHRLEGLMLLEKLITQGNTEVFIKHGRSWMNLLLQVLQSHCPARHHHVTCHVIKLLLVECKSLPELAREIATSFLPQILPLLLEASEEWADQSVGCINTCIRYYPGPCGTFKGKIEGFILPYLDREYPEEEAIRCYSLLAGCGGSGNLGLKYTEGWSRQCDRVLVSLWRVLTHLYRDLDTDLPVLEQSGLPLRPIPDPEPERSNLLQSRYQMLCGCLGTLLREDFSATAKIPVEDILTLVCRTLAVNNKMLLSRPTTERVLLAYIIPSLHTAALKLLSALILCTKKILLPYTASVSSQLTQVVSWTHTHTCTPGLNKPYSLLRGTVYSVACDWFKTLGGACNLWSLGSEFIQELLSDIQSDQSDLKIDSSKATNNNGPSASKKRKKGGGYQEISQGQGLAKKVNKTANHTTCYMALEALRWLLHTVGSTVKTKVMKEIVRCLMEVCVTVLQSGSLPPAPYGHPRCREELYRAVLALVLVPHPTFPPPVHPAFRLLQTGLDDPDMQVSSCCREALNVVEVMIHPRVPCLQPVVKLADPPILIGETSRDENPVVETRTRENDSVHSFSPPHPALHSLGDMRETETAEIRGVLSHGEKSQSLEKDFEDDGNSWPKLSDSVSESPGINEKPHVEEDALTSGGRSISVGLPSASQQNSSNQIASDIADRDSLSCNLINQKDSNGNHEIAMDTDTSSVPESETQETNKSDPRNLTTRADFGTVVETDSDEEMPRSESQDVRPGPDISAEKQSDDLDAMLSSFVDASPDRDSGSE